jgi:hypothetical protein
VRLQTSLKWTLHAFGLVPEDPPQLVRFGFYQGILREFAQIEPLLTANRTKKTVSRESSDGYLRNLKELEDKRHFFRSTAGVTTFRRVKKLEILARINNFGLFLIKMEPSNDRSHSALPDFVLKELQPGEKVQRRDGLLSFTSICDNDGHS